MIIFVVSDELKIYWFVILLSTIKFMTAADIHTKEVLRRLREEGKLSNPTGVDDESASYLLETPPTTDIVRGVVDPGPRTTGIKLPAASQDTEPLTDTLAQLESECKDFQKALETNTTMSLDQTKRSLLQLFEDTIRDRIVSSVIKKARVSTSFGAAGTGANVARLRPFDAGLSKKERGMTDFVIEDALRADISSDIGVITSHELKRIVGSIAEDINRVMNSVQRIKSRATLLEEQVVQGDVESKMHSEQLQRAEDLISSLQNQVKELQDHHVAKDAQMDVLREQLSRRNQSLDEARIRFRKEVLRYKQRIFELEPADADGKKRRVSGASWEKEGDSTEELTAAAETAVREAMVSMQEEQHKREIQFQRERKALSQEMQLKISERDSEIIRLKEKLRSALAQ